MGRTSLLEGYSSGGLVPVRFLGFGFFWAWLFVTTLSPSPLFGSVACLGGMPFEMLELAARSVALVCALAASRRLATAAGCRVMLMASLVAGASVAPLVLLVGGPAAASAAAVLAGVAEVVMFLLWLSFFGYMRLGDTLALLIVSYGAGSLLFLGVLALGRTAMVAASVLLPVASCVTFVLSARLHAARTGEEIFGGTVGAGEGSRGGFRALPMGRFAVPFVKMTAGLGSYSFAFALISAVSLRSGDGASYTYLVEPACIVVLAVAFVAMAAITRRIDALYPTYRAVAPLMGFGFALLALGAPPAVACVFVALGYLAFEVLALNDYCNLVQADDSSLFGTMAFARLVISVGMAVGWLAGYGAYLLVPAESYVSVMATAALLVVLFVGTLAFTDRDVATMSSLADDRAVVEETAPLLGKDEALELFAGEAALSKRETEVLGWLVEGRTTSYIAAKLFVAESTVRAHVHSIYRKTGVKSRMELLDAFEARRARGRAQG